MGKDATWVISYKLLVDLSAEGDIFSVMPRLPITYRTCSSDGKWGSYINNKLRSCTGTYKQPTSYDWAFAVQMRDQASNISYWSIAALDEVRLV